MCRGLPRPTPRLVADTDLQRANAARAAIGQASIVAGPAVGSLLLAVCSPPAVILLNAISFLASAATVAAIRPGPAFAAPPPAANGVAPAGRSPGYCD